MRRRVREHFAEGGRPPRGTPRMWAKGLFFCALYVAAYLLLVLAATAWWQAIPLAVVLGTAMAAIGFNVQHDGSHDAYARRGWVNRLAASSLDFIGGSSYVWKLMHVKAHHPHPNVAGVDADIDFTPFLRLAPSQPRYWFHRFQHVYAWLLYASHLPLWHFVNDFRQVLRGARGEGPVPPPRGVELAGFLAGKACFFALAFALPSAFHPIGVVVLGYLGVVAVASLISATVIQLAHCVEGAEHGGPLPIGDSGTRPWAECQLAATADFAPTNRALTWFCGGLNFQIEHHLFPNIAHVHLREVSAIVRSVCRENHVPYLVHGTVREAILSHVRWLRHMGRARLDEGPGNVASPGRGIPPEPLGQAS